MPLGQYSPAGVGALLAGRMAADREQLLAEQSPAELGLRRECRGSAEVGEQLGRLELAEVGTLFGRAGFAEAVEVLEKRSYAELGGPLEQ